MVQRYCDCCGCLIDSHNVIDGEHSRLTGELRRYGGDVLLQVEVITAKDFTWNAGDFCKYCVIDAIIKADDRPKAASAEDHQSL